MKSYTDIEQSKKLTKILPFESADMYYPYNGIETYPEVKNGLETKTALYCWSLAALLSVLPNYQLQTQDDGIGILCSCNGKFNIVTASNPIDACVEMIIRLNELKML